MEVKSETFHSRKEKLSTGVIITIAAISLFVASACKVMLPNGQIMSRSAYLAKRDKARKKCNKFLPEPLRDKEFEKVFCHPCAERFRKCINAEFK